MGAKMRQPAPVSPNSTRKSARRSKRWREKTLEVNFFKGAFAKSRGSTPEQRTHWREGVYDEIQELMPLQGSP